MAANNEYKIIIEYGALPDGSDKGEAPGGDGNATARKAAVSTASAVVMPFVNTAMRMHTQEIVTLTGSSQLANRQQIVNSAVGAAVKMGEGLLGGASIGASLGAAVGISAGPAALIGVAMTAVSKALEAVAKAQDLANRQEVENTSISVTRARAGISWNRSRSR